VLVGGKNGEGKATPFFMVRNPSPDRLLSSHQARTIADLAERHARGVARYTVRQISQFTG